MIKVQLLTPTAKPPVKIDPNAVGWDIFADSVKCQEGMLIYGTGIAVEPPEGYFFAMYPRSSQSGKGCVFGNSVGIIEPEYRGEIQVRLKPTPYFEDDDFVTISVVARTKMSDAIFVPFQIGERIAQLVLHKLENSEIQVVDQLNETQRGTGGFGSTGK